jgi:hypothetical protein
MDNFDWLDQVPADDGTFTAHLRDAVRTQVAAATPPQQGLTVDKMRPKLEWIDRDFVPQQPPTSILAPWWPQASNVNDWLTGPPGRPQAEDDPAYKRRLEGTMPLPGVRPATEMESYNRLMGNAPWIVDLARRLNSK